MAYNKITLNGETKIDLTQDTVTAEDVALGKTFHLNSGEVATGTLEISSGGGEEMKQETYAGSDVATLYTRLINLMSTGKLLGLNLIIKKEISNTGYHGTLSSSGSVKLYNNSAYTFSTDQILHFTPAHYNPNYNNVRLISTLDNLTDARLTITNSDVKFTSNGVSVSMETNMMIFYLRNFEIPLDSVDFKISYFE